MSFNIEDVLSTSKDGSLNFKFGRANEFMTVSLLIVFAQSCANENFCDWYQIKEEKIRFPTVYDTVSIFVFKILKYLHQSRFPFFWDTLYNSPA